MSVSPTRTPKPVATADQPVTAAAVPDDLPVTPHGLNWALAALALGGLGIGTGEFVPMGLLPDVASGVGASLTATGHVISAYAVGVVVGAPLIGVLGSKTPRRRLLLMLMAFYVAANLISAVAPSYETLLAARFLSGLPHGAFFGVASLAAAALVPFHRRAWAITMTMLGLSVANLLVVPLATAMGHALGWRSVFVAVAAIGVATILAIIRFVPVTQTLAGASMRSELGALRDPKLLLTLSVGAIGFGGMFAVYSYIAPTLTERTGVDESLVPLYLFFWGAGMVSGNLIGGRLIDRALMPTLAGGLALFAVALAVFSVASLNPYTAAVGVFVLGNVLLLGPALQSRLMDVAGNAQTVAATMNHASFNTANALGPLLAGLAFTATGSWAAPAWVGVGLALGGLLLLWASLRAPTRLTAGPARLNARRQPLATCKPFGSTRWRRRAPRTRHRCRGGQRPDSQPRAA
ncbi:MAG: MFS transporter [Solirubrobacteraceae bacterium]|nr:MFS transporter [Solirubrobacteraceae bacterium]